MLSDRAKAQRRNDMASIAESAPIDKLVSILAIGVLLLAKDVMNRLTPFQRLCLYLIVSAAGGAAIVSLIMAQQIMFALLAMFLVGVLFNEIRHI